MFVCNIYTALDRQYVAIVVRRWKVNKFNFPGRSYCNGKNCFSLRPSQLTASISLLFAPEILFD